MIETIKQKSVTVAFEDGRQIKVRRMPWKAARSFLRKVTKIMNDVLGEGGLGSKIKAAEGKVTFNLSDVTAALPGLIEQSDELVFDLVTASTPLKTEELDALDTLEASSLIKAAIEVNFDAELKNCWSGVVAGLAALMTSPRTSPSPASTSGSAARDSQPSISTTAPIPTSTSS